MAHEEHLFKIQFELSITNDSLTEIPSFRLILLTYDTFLVNDIQF